MSSRSSTQGSHAYSSDLEESKFLRDTRSIYLGRLVLSFLAIAVAIAVIVCESVPFRHYLGTAEWASTGLALWPQNLDLRPTIAALSCGCVIAFMNLTYVTTALLPSVSILSTELRDPSLSHRLTSQLVLLAPFSHQIA